MHEKGRSAGGRIEQRASAGDACSFKFEAEDGFALAVGVKGCPTEHLAHDVVVDLITAAASELHDAPVNDQVLAGAERSKSNRLPVRLGQHDRAGVHRQVFN